ncbi:MAG: helix-turn-helix domain-containing protein [Pseudoxanthomonas sp.]
MRAKFYPATLKDEAVRLVIEKRLTASEAALRLNIRAEAVQVWVRRYRNRRLGLTERVGRLKAELHQARTEYEALALLSGRLVD